MVLNSMMISSILSINFSLSFSVRSRQWWHAGLLLVWLTIGLILRFTNLASKPASSIEIATLGFSFGHSFAQVPIDQVISARTLLAPLRFAAANGAGDVVHNLFSQSTHPPVYFVLSHYWQQLFLADGELASLWVGRSLSAIFGAASIPAMFGLGWLAFRSRLVGQIAAALMAVSPYGIYLAQEARHYTLTIVWIIASVACWLVATRCLVRRQVLPIPIVCVWIVVNCLGVATHYFFSLALATQAVVIAVMWLRDWRQNPLTSKYWRPIYAVALGTGIGCLVWVTRLAAISGNELTDWIATSYDVEEIWQPIPRCLAWWLTMIVLVPVEGTPLTVTIIAVVAALLILAGSFPSLWWGWQRQMAALPMRFVSSFFWGAIAIFLLIIYGWGKDLSLAARYHFVYFPVLLLMVAAALAACWNGQTPGKSRRTVVIAIVVMGLIGALTVVCNYGFQKSRHSDFLASQIQSYSQAPALIAMTYETHSEIRELMGLALSFQRQDISPSPKFVLVKRRQNNVDVTVSTMTAILQRQQRPLDLWAVNLKIDSDDLEPLNCHKDSQLNLSDTGYRDRLYHCR